MQFRSNQNALKSKLFFTLMGEHTSNFPYFARFGGSESLTYIWFSQSFYKIPKMSNRNPRKKIEETMTVKLFQMLF